jgi:hypothetical protein
MRLVASGQPKIRISTASSELLIALEDVKRIVLLTANPIKRLESQRRYCGNPDHS